MPAIPEPNEIWINNKTQNKYKVIMITQDSEGEPNGLAPWANLRVVYTKSDYEYPWDRPLILFMEKFTKKEPNDGFY